MPEKPPNTEGLGGEPKSDWPRVRVGADSTRSIDKLRPGTVIHNRLREYLLARLDASEREMETFYARWEINETKIQAYISLPDWEQKLKELNDLGEVPRITRIIVPYSFSTISTITTFLLHAFAGRRPIFQLGTYKDESMDAARNMEQKMQYDADHTRLVRHLWKFLQDTQTYGVGIMLDTWDVEFGKRTKRPTREFITSQQAIVNARTVERETVVTYEGNTVVSIDPYMFFPDPSVPMSEVNKHGEYVFWRRYLGKHKLLRMESEGKLKWVNWASMGVRDRGFRSARGLLSRGRGIAGLVDNDLSTSNHQGQPMQVDQGTVEIIPKELGLSDSERVEKWIFTILNRDQIVQAEHFDTDHDKHPICVSEPYALGHGFGEPGMADYLGPIQDVISWFFDSHIDNVRKSLNDMFIVDPSMVEMQDVRNPGPGKLIRLKRAAYGQDVRGMIQQLQVQDVTAGHVADAQEVMKLGQMLSAVSENIQGVQDAGGRKTATEVRQSGQAAASRLAAQARIISAEAITDLTEMMSLNNQQFLSDEFFMRVVGMEAVEERNIGVSDLVGDFNFPVHDGTLPLDKVALMDIWKELFAVVVQDEQLRQTHSIPRIFEHIAELGGARDIERFRIVTQPDKAVQQGVQDGNLTPIGNNGELPNGQRLQGIPTGGENIVRELGR